ncbi:MAG: DUF711 family protein [Rhodothermales bacterium]|nr:DUF711 family protein [Rhodothermales bacterium]
MQREASDQRQISITRLHLESVTLGISLRDCSSRLASTAKARIYDKVRRAGGQLARCVNDTVNHYGSSAEHVFATVSPVSTLFDAMSESDYVGIAETLNAAAIDIGLEAIGGYSALCSAGMSAGDQALIRSLPAMLSSTDRMCASVECAKSQKGIGIAASELISSVLAGIRSVSGPAGYRPDRISVLANASGNSPYVPGSFHGIDEPEVALHIAVSSKYVHQQLLHRIDDGSSLDDAADDVANQVERLRRGGRFLSIRCAETLSQRSGMDVRPGRVDISMPVAESSVIHGNRTEHNGVSAASARTTTESAALAARQGLLSLARSTSSFAGAPIIRRVVKLDSTSSPREVTGLILPHLAEAVRNGVELILSIESTRQA